MAKQKEGQKEGQKAAQMETLCEGFGLIEGPVWYSERDLIFSDVLEGGIYCVSAHGHVVELFPHRRGVGGMVLHEAGGVVVSGRNIAFKSFEENQTQVFLDRDEAAGLVGFNDITTDRKGRVYAGGLGGSPFDDKEQVPQHLYMIDLDGTTHTVADDILLTNGLGFSPDGLTLYHSDSLRRTVHCYDVLENGSLGPKQDFVKLKRGAPDGLAVAEDGSVWVALAAGGKGVAVFNADGTERDFIEIPHPMCTSVCFGGDDLKDLFIVSGSDGLPTSTGGGVFKIRVEVPGIPVPHARVALPLD